MQVPGEVESKAPLWPCSQVPEPSHSPEGRYLSTIL